MQKFSTCSGRHKELKYFSITVLFGLLSRLPTKQKLFEEFAKNRCNAKNLNSKCSFQ